MKEKMISIINTIYTKVLWFVALILSKITAIIPVIKEKSVAFVARVKGFQYREAFNKTVEGAKQLPKTFKPKASAFIAKVKGYNYKQSFNNFVTKVKSAPSVVKGFMAGFKAAGTENNNPA